jgi:hypothetical protein
VSPDRLPALRRHLERALGASTSTLAIPVPGRGELHVDRHPDRPVEGATTFVTAGLSSVGPRVELLLSTWTPTATEEVARLAGAVALLALKDPPSRGEVLGPAGPLVAGTSMEALYVAPAIVLPDEARRILLSDDDEVELLWLIPIHKAEVAWIERRGSTAFEAALGPLEPDLLDLGRAPLALPDADPA